jgi:hypothetical protein
VKYQTDTTESKNVTTRRGLPDFSGGPFFVLFVFRIFSAVEECGIKRLSVRQKNAIIPVTKVPKYINMCNHVELPEWQRRIWHYGKYGKKDDGSRMEPVYARSDAAGQCAGLFIQ